MSKRHFWKINPDLKSGLDFFPEMTLLDIPEMYQIGVNWNPS